MSVTEYGFDLHTAVQLDPPQALIEPRLSGFGGAHGGYIAAIALRAMGQALADERAPRSLSLHLLAAIEAGTVDLEPRVERQGSSLSSTSLRIEQGGATVATALASFGQARPSVAYEGLEMPAVPAPEECSPIGEKPAPDAEVGLFVEHRPAAPPLPLSGGERAEILVWMRLLEDRPLDALSLAVLADAGPPALFGHLSAFVPMPSTEIVVHFAELEAAAASPWVLGSFRTLRAAEGYAVEDGELWTPDGRLVLVARQQRRILGAG